MAQRAKKILVTEILLKIKYSRSGVDGKTNRAMFIGRAGGFIMRSI